MDRFTWKEEGELLIGRTQCEFCIYNQKDDENKCIKYSSKPKEVLSGEIRCIEFKDDSFDEQ